MTNYDCLFGTSEDAARSIWQTREWLKELSEYLKAQGINPHSPNVGTERRTINATKDWLDQERELKGQL